MGPNTHSPTHDTWGSPTHTPALLCMINPCQHNFSDWPSVTANTPQSNILLPQHDQELSLRPSHQILCPTQRKSSQHQQQLAAARCTCHRSTTCTPLHSFNISNTVLQLFSQHQRDHINILLGNLNATNSQLQYCSNQVFFCSSITSFLAGKPHIQLLLHITQCIGSGISTILGPHFSVVSPFLSYGVPNATFLASFMAGICITITVPIHHHSLNKTHPLSQELFYHFSLSGESKNSQGSYITAGFSPLEMWSDLFSESIIEIGDNWYHHCLLILNILPDNPHLCGSIGWDDNILSCLDNVPCLPKSHFVLLPFSLSCFWVGTLT